jgi:hypothetical protein
MAAELDPNKEESSKKSSRKTSSSDRDDYNTGLSGLQEAEVHTKPFRLLALPAVEKQGIL